MPDVGVRELKARASEIIRNVRERRARLDRVGRGLRLAYHRGLLNREVRMLVENRREDYLGGYTDRYVPCRVPASCVRGEYGGKFLAVRVGKATEEFVGGLPGERHAGRRQGSVVERVAIHGDLA